MGVESNEFPLSVLPEPVIEIVNELHRCYGYPIEYTSSSMLVAFAAAMGNDWSLLVKGDWRERALLYMALVGNAGANKTHPMKFALKPLIEEDIRKIDNAKAVEPYVAPPRFIASDVTQEGLVKLHQSNPRGLCLFVDELKAWIANFSRYSGGSQEQFWLSNFSRSPIVVDRKGSPEPITIAQPLISVIGSTQPSVLRTFAQGDKSTNGFVDRLLFATRLNAGKSSWSDEIPSFDIEGAWRSILHSIFERKLPFDCVFDTEAMAFATEWQSQNAKRINECKDERLVGGYSKLEIYFVRFCLILHAMHTACFQVEDNLAVRSYTVGSAILLTEYFRGQLELAQDLLYPDVSAEISDKNKRFLEALPSSFSRPQAVRIAKTLGIGRSAAYVAIKAFTGVFIDVAEDGDFYKLDMDLN